MKFFLRALTLLGALGLAGAAAALAVAVGAYIYVAPDLPSVETLKDVRLQVPLRVYSRDGRLLAEFGEKRRTPVSYEDIPEVVIQAFTAAEDDRFFQHPGVDYQGLVRAAWSLATTGERRQGGSTITMQVARNFFLTPEKTIARKVREIFLALKIERELSKQEILTLYLNKIFLGQRAWGVAAAAEVYFGRPLDDLSLAEVATIAGLPKAPSTDNPVTSPERALDRRLYVLRRMRELNHIDDPTFYAAAEAPVLASLHGPSVELEAPYVAEMVRAEMLRRFGAEAYTAGFAVRTTLDSRLQEAASSALRRALREYDVRHGWRGALDRRAEVPAADDVGELEAVLDEYPRAADLALGLVLEAGKESAQVYVRRLGPVELPLAAVTWAKPHLDENRVGDEPTSITDVLAPGDVVYLRAEESDDGTSWRLAQLPAVQGALVSMDPQDGALVALSGGYDFFTSKFNRAMQAQRQPGSSFKPFVYSAALEQGLTPATMVPDSPVVFEDAQLENTWRPENYSREFHGLMRLREALIKSRNLVSIRVLRNIGIDYALDYLQRFGFGREQLPRDLSLALGSAVFTPVEMVSAYSVLASGGFRTDAYYIEQIRGADGALVFDADPRVVCAACTEAMRVEPEDEPTLLRTAAGAAIRANNDGLSLEHTTSCDLDPTADIFPYRSERLAPQVISAQNAYLVSDMMRDVIRRGTGVAIMELGRSDLSGKTGTTNEQRDAWFSGFNADLATVAWVGFDQVKPLGRGEVGGRAALPAWKYFMREALEGVPEHIVQQPSGIIRVKISPESGLLARSTDSDWIYEIFRDGHVPAAATTDPWQLPGDRPEEEVQDEPLF